MAKTRVTKHNGRVTTAKHNDRNFDVENAPHIDKDKSKDNKTFMWCGDEVETFEEAEQKFYNEHFSQALDEQNERHRKARNYKRIKTMDEFRTNKNTCPEEVILQWGKFKDDVDRTKFFDACDDYMEWEDETFGKHLKILDAALHKDEATEHLQYRRVWIYTDENGVEHVGQEEALKQMGFERPDPSKEKSRFNNRKMVFDKQCREKWMDICEQYGLDVERTPMPNQRHRDTPSFKWHQDEMRRKQLDERENQLNTRESDLNARENDLKAREDHLSELIDKEAEKRSEGFKKAYKAKCDETLAKQIETLKKANMNAQRLSEQETASKQRFGGDIDKFMNL